MANVGVQALALAIGHPQPRPGTAANQQFTLAAPWAACPAGREGCRSGEAGNPLRRPGGRIPRVRELDLGYLKYGGHQDCLLVPGMLRQHDFSDV